MNFVDLNGHILHEYDPNIKNINETLEIIKKASNIGIETIIETPNNVFLHKVESTEIQEKIDNLTSFLTELEINNMNLLLGSEINLDIQMPANISLGKTLTINSTKYLLIKFPYLGLPENFESTLSLLNIMGINPILLNLEKNNYIQKNPKIIFELIKENCLIQLSSSSLLNSSNENVRSFSQFLIKNQLVHTVSGFVNSQISDIEKNLEEIIDFIESSSNIHTVELLLYTNPNLIAYGNDPRTEIEIIKPTKIKSFFKYPIQKIPTLIEYFHWKLLSIIKYLKIQINNLKYRN
ncbi:MAG: hypothetical protein CL764_04825 [Chloroflexi bacterium]|nr:hypothetical protein [Chloroflexota bacterium]|tara:strand:+ start:2845 stop:3726 length:882 start_codon:yes stop_codon:yes gene_type:complete